MFWNEWHDTKNEITRINQTGHKVIVLEFEPLFPRGKPYLSFIDFRDFYAQLLMQSLSYVSYREEPEVARPGSYLETRMNHHVVPEGIISNITCACASIECIGSESFYEKPPCDRT